MASVVTKPKTASSSGWSERRLPPPRHDARPVPRCLLLVVEVADEADELAQALDVEGVEVDLVAAAGGPGRLGPEPLDESPLVVVAGHACSVKSWATSCSPAAVR